MRPTLFIGLLCFANLIQAEPVTNVVKEINASKLYVYDAAGDEIDVLKASAVKKEFTTVSVGGETVEGLAVKGINDEEGLVAVSLSKYPEPVWIETMSVEIWPGNRLDCPEVAVGKAEIEKSGMTIGFGDHCKPSEDEKIED